MVLEWGFSELFFELLMSGLSSVWSHNNSNYTCASHIISDGNLTFTCSCKQGYEGNAYLARGCQGKPLAVYLFIYLFGVK